MDPNDNLKPEQPKLKICIRLHEIASYLEAALTVSPTDTFLCKKYLRKFERDEAEEYFAESKQFIGLLTSNNWLLDETRNELSQFQDWSEIGFERDLIRDLRKILLKSAGELKETLYKSVG